MSEQPPKMEDQHYKGEETKEEEEEEVGPISKEAEDEASLVVVQSYSSHMGVHIHGTKCVSLVNKDVTPSTEQQEEQQPPPPPEEQIKKKSRHKRNGNPLLRSAHEILVAFLYEEIVSSIRKQPHPSFSWKHIIRGHSNARINGFHIKFLLYGHQRDGYTWHRASGIQCTVEEQLNMLFRPLFLQVLDVTDPTKSRNLAFRIRVIC